MYVGLEHSTTGVKVGIVSDDDHVTAFRILSDAIDEQSPFEDELEARFNVDDIELAAFAYSWGNGFSQIKPLSEVENRGLRELEDLPDRIGFASDENDAYKAANVFDELTKMSVPSVALPGINEPHPDHMHPYFTIYSPLLSLDKIADARYAQHVFRQNETDGKHFITVNMSSSTVSSLVPGGKVRGGFSWLALIHGWFEVPRTLDLMRGEIEPGGAALSAGLLAKSGKSLDALEGAPDEDLLRLVYWAVLHDVYSMVPFSDIKADTPLEGIVITGRLSPFREPFDVPKQFSDGLSDVGPVTIAEPFSCAYGAAHIAKEICNGASHVLGLPVSDKVEPGRPGNVERAWAIRLHSPRWRRRPASNRGHRSASPGPYRRAFGTVEVRAWSGRGLSRQPRTGGSLRR
ncbi:hypothetical protein BRC85_06000 [Halobacteriales archaeon QS_1_69_70]|nr:MAG: hypothetical protein BRC85_06000 [Halobacteriales archaeon QS_1_69_70]